MEEFGGGEEGAMRAPEWQYDELRQVGVDYDDPAQVAAYDERHRKFRNIEEDNARIIEAIRLGPEDLLLDMGTGTGHFALQAAALCRRVVAVDVSLPMLAYARGEAARRGIDQVEFHHGGFLTYEHGAGEPLDAIVSQIALHHLPDFWKLVSLRRLHGMLRSGGRLYLSDVVFSLPEGGEGERGPFLDARVREAVKEVGQGFAKEWLLHIREEFSTLDWIMEGLLKRAGFLVERCEYRDGLFADYLCKKAP